MASVLCSSFVLFLALEASLGALTKKSELSEEGLQKRQDYGDYGDYAAALLEDGDDDDGLLYAAFAYDVDDEGGEGDEDAIYDYGDPDYEGTEKKEEERRLLKRADQPEGARTEDAVPDPKPAQVKA